MLAQKNASNTIESRLWSIFLHPLDKLDSSAGYLVKNYEPAMLIGNAHLAVRKSAERVLKAFDQKMSGKLY